jgi:serine/threonine protein phosphatase PrpC
MIRTDVRLGWKSIPGHRHLVEGRENEDAAFIAPEHPYFDALMLLADGMGGHPEPRLAAETAIGAARDFLMRPERLVELAERRADPPTLLRRAVEHANAHVRRLAVRLPAGAASEKPPGCTLTVAAVAEGRLVVAHVGDGSVFLLRDGRLRPLAGGEARRFGSRPEEFLGRGDRVQVETAGETAQPGDRIVLCTDGLTRYFGDGRSPAGEPARGAGGRPAANGSLERLQQVVSRLSADPQTLASQLTADGRGEEYEDDTTVIVAEIGTSREAPDPPLPALTGARRGASVGDGAAGRAGGGATARREETDPPGRPLARSPARPVGVALALAAMVIAGIAWWRPWRLLVAPEPPPFHAPTAASVDLSGLPRGGVLLLDRESGRFFLLRTRPASVPIGAEPVTLQELRFQPGKDRVDTLNSYRYDPARGRLTAPNGRVYPVTVDSGSGLMEVQQSGTLWIDAASGLQVLIDGLKAGATPLNTRVRAGRHQVQVRGAKGRSVVYDAAVEIPPGAILKIPISGLGAGAAGGRER